MKLAASEASPTAKKSKKMIEKLPFGAFSIGVPLATSNETVAASTYPTLHPKDKSRHPENKSRLPTDNSRHPTDISRHPFDKSRHQTPKNLEIIHKKSCLSIGIPPRGN